jgi:hypothetical protein
MKVIKLIFVIIILHLYSESKSQDMKEKFPRMLTKKEVQDFIKSGEAVYDSALSREKNMDVYKFSDGRLIFKRADGKGAYWKSLQQIEETVNKSQIENDIFNMKDWIRSKEQLSVIKEKSLQLLKDKTKKELDYSMQSLQEVSKIKINNVVSEKDLLYAIFYYSCEVCAREVKGTVDIDLISGEKYYRPIVKDNRDRVYVPYSEYLEAFVENTKINIAQSVEIELNKFKFFN